MLFRHLEARSKQCVLSVAFVLQFVDTRGTEGAPNETGDCGRWPDLVRSERHNFGIESSSFASAFSSVASSLCPTLSAVRRREVQECSLSANLKVHALEEHLAGRVTLGLLFRCFLGGGEPCGETRLEMMDDFQILHLAGVIFVVRTR